MAKEFSVTVPATQKSGVRRTKRIEIECPRKTETGGGEIEVRAFREEITGSGNITTVEDVQTPVRRVLNFGSKETVTLTNGKTITQSELAEAAAMWIDAWDA